MLTLAFPGEGIPRDALTAREVQIWRDEAGQPFARGAVAGRTRWLWWRGLGTFAIGPDRRAVRAWPHAGMPRETVAATFERVVQPVLLQGFGYQTLHASAVLTPSGVIGFCGVRRSGKSTIAFGLGAHGWTQTADDALVISIGSGPVLVHPLPFIPRLREATFQHFAGPSEVLPRQRSRPTPESPPLLMIFVLRQEASAERPQIDLVPPVQAFAALLQHAHQFDETDREDARRLAEDYLAVVDRVPVRSLTYGADLGRLPELLSAIRKEVGTREAASTSAVGVSR